MRVVFFTKYTSSGPSSRYRTYQYIPILQEHFECEIHSFFNDKYINKINENSNFNFLNYLFLILKRFYLVFFKIKKNDKIFIEYELIPYFPPILEYFLYFRKIKFILDYNDAIFHNYDQHPNYFIKFLLANKIQNIVKLASCVITGSPYLTSCLSLYNKNVIEIPTSIDINLYKKHTENSILNNTIIVGWIGSKTTSKNLLKLRDVFIELSIKFDFLEFHFCGFDKSLISNFTFKNSKFFDWSIDFEPIFLNSISIGIMPLENNLFNKGKCGFKLIQYMAMGKPTISYPFAANVKINHNNGNQFARNNHEWFSILSKMIFNIDTYKIIGSKNKEIIEKLYSIQANYFKYISIIKSI